MTALRRLPSLIAPILTAGLLSGCTAGVMGPRPGDSASPALVRSPQIRCPTANLTNQDSGLREALRAAMADACAILESDAFRAQVEGSQLARKCPLLPFKKHKLLAGSDIYRKLAQGMPESISITAAEVGWRSTIAITNASTRSISIKPWRFADWVNGPQEKRSGMINTLVHEMTHLVEPSPGEGSYFQDGGQWTPWCDQNLLVSYALGDAAEKQWIGTHP